MDDQEPCQKLLAVARSIPPDNRVPYAFEKRIMACVAELAVLADPWAFWERGLVRAAGLCVVVTLLFAGVSFFVPARTAQLTLPQAVAQTLLAGVDTSLDQIGDTP